MTIQQDVPLARMTTLQVGGEARHYIEATDEQEVSEACRWAREQDLPLAVLGGGSNLLVPDGSFDGVVLHIRLLGTERTGDLFDVAAGEDWDRFVSQTVDAGFGGVECLAGIPGTVGASPVQNIGAYGQEVAETIESVRAYDRTTRAFVEIGRDECGFRYRKSRFNTEEPGRFLLTRVRFRLRGGAKPELRYADLQRRFANGPEPGLRAVAAAVRSIRAEKGMVLIPGDPDTQSAGSYFKNPVVPSGQLEGVAAAAGKSVAEVPHWPAEDGCEKLSAAWLVERAGFPKGYRNGAAGLSTKHALALTNRGGARCADILRLEEEVRSGVQSRFGVTLEREPVLLGDPVAR